MAPAFARAHQENMMSRVRQSNKELKKQPVMTPKEKKHAKHAKKHASDIMPLISR
jgi:LDH2 family malate/lactate/ureidoglycolate dehydrogenase